MRRRRDGVVVTSLVTVLLLVTLTTASAAWVVRRSLGGRLEHGTRFRRADRLACSAAVEALVALRREVADPGVADPGELLPLDGWFRALRPPVSYSRPSASPQDRPLDCPRARALIQAEGLRLEAVTASLVAAPEPGDLPQGLVEVEVRLRLAAREGAPLRVTRERWSFHLIRRAGDGWGGFDEFVVVFADRPVGRIHATR